MSFTIETASVLPLTIAIIIGVISSGEALARRTQQDIRGECRSLWQSAVNRSIYKTEVDGEEAEDSWSMDISVNPVRMKEMIGIARDQVRCLDDCFRIILSMGDPSGETEASND